MKKNVLVVIPGGSSEGSDSDDVYDLLVEPSLQALDVNIIRLTEATPPFLVDSEATGAGKFADACILDMSSQSPLAFYVFGMRQALEMHVITLLEASAQQPFDVSASRTIRYDLASPRALRDSATTLRENLLRTISVQTKSPEPPAALRERMDSIDRALARIEGLLTTDHLRSGHALRAPSMAETDDDVIRDLMKSPRTAYLDAIRQGRMEDALRLLDRLRKTTSPSEFASALAIPLAAGVSGAVPIAEAFLDETLSNHTASIRAGEIVQTLSEGFKRYYENSGGTTEGVAFFESLYKRVLENQRLTAADKAFVANKAGMLAWVLDDHEACISYTRKAANLNPEEPAYLYNLALAYDADGRSDDMTATLEALAALPGLDEDHLKLLERHGTKRAG